MMESLTFTWHLSRTELIKINFYPEFIVSIHFSAQPSENKDITKFGAGQNEYV
jgi:hypothetical protein